jgi:thioredoxin reductase (NADPH)
MSKYLIDQLRAIPGICVRPGLIVERVEGDSRLQRVYLRSLEAGSTEMLEADALFIFIGTRPNSDWLAATVLRDNKGFILTGRDLPLLEEFPRVWKEDREPFPLETSIAGLFAAGDVRAGAMNRVASAVGEGSMAVRLVFDYLARS